MGSMIELGTGVLKWDCLLDMRICSQKRTPSVLEMGREAGCEWDSWTCAYAAQNGHLECLKWAQRSWLQMELRDMCICSQKWTSSVLEMGQESAVANGIPGHAHLQPKMDI